MVTRFCIKKRVQSFKYAINGIFVLITTQHNARIHLLATILVIIAGVYFHIQTMEWLFLVIAIGAVWITEAINTALEFLCDHITSEHHPQIEKTKDLAAASVLIAAIGSAIIGFIIFIPYIKLL